MNRRRWGETLPLDSKVARRADLHNLHEVTSGGCCWGQESVEMEEVRRWPALIDGRMMEPSDTVMSPSVTICKYFRQMFRVFIFCSYTLDSQTLP